MTAPPSFNPVTTQDGVCKHINTTNHLQFTHFSQTKPAMPELARGFAAKAIERRPVVCDSYHFMRRHSDADQGSRASLG